MGRRCSTCAHPQRPEIDSAVVQNTESYRIIAKKYSISFASLQRHVRAGHISKELREEYKTEGLIQREELLEQLRDLQRLLYKFLRDANNKEELRDVIMLTKEIRGLIELLGKFLGRFPREPEINILVNPTWISLKQQIFKALEPFPNAHNAVLTAVADAQTLSGVQRKMIAGELDHKEISPEVLAIINKEFEKEPEHAPMTPAVKAVCDHIMEYDSEEEQHPNKGYQERVDREAKAQGWKVKEVKPAVEVKLCYRCVSPHTFHGRRWAVGQIWDSSDPDGPEPPAKDHRWQLYNPAEKVSGLLPTKRR